MNDELMLSYLATCYFHQDYDVYGLPPLETVKRFAESEGLQLVQMFYVELAEILAGRISEEGAQVLWMDDAGAMYEPTRDGLGYLEWLTSILMTVGAILRLRWLTPRSSLP